MKTPTLIVRLIGLYLIVQSAIALIQLWRFGALASGNGVMRNAMVSDMVIYSILGLLAGFAAFLKAGRLADILTFDASRD